MGFGKERAQSVALDIVEVGHLENGQALYRDYGTDRTESSDDILTYYTFDYAGRSANAYTTDVNQRILGASNAVYSGVGSTDKTNNRTLRAASIGVAAMNELRDHSFELSAAELKFHFGSDCICARNLPHLASKGKPVRVFRLQLARNDISTPLTGR